MDLKKLLGLRPAGKSSADIRSAIERVEAEASAATARAVEMETGRGKLLLTGDLATVQRGEAALSDTREEAERLSAMAEAMRAELATTLTSEKAAELRELVKQMEAEGAAFLDFWKNEYPALARQIAAGMRHLRAEEAARDAFTMASMNYAAVEEGGVQPPPTLGQRLFPESHPGVGLAFNMVQLPSPDGAPFPNGQTPVIWPTQRGE